MEIHTLLKMPPFQGITEEELLSLILAPEHARRQYKPADFIAMQGEAYRSLFILCSGSVRTQMVSAEGKQLTIETLKAPQLLAPAFVFASEVPASTPHCDAQLSATGIGQNSVPLQKAECLCPAKPEIAHTELSTHAWHDTQPAGSGTNTGSGASLAGTCLIGAGKRRVHPAARKLNMRVASPPQLPT